MNVMLDEGAFAPTRAHEQDAGLDLYAMEDQVVPARESAVFDTGVHVELPFGCAGLLVSKSGLNVKFDITSTGLIDEGYTGSIKVKLYNHGGYDLTVRRGNKISQLVIFPVRYEPVRLAREINGGDRGNNGFGSTGR